MVRRPKVKPPKEVVVVPKVLTKEEREAENKKTFDEIVNNKEMLSTLKGVLFERGYIVVTEDDMVREMATQRVITGNEARPVIRRVVKNILAREEAVTDL